MDNLTKEQRKKCMVKIRAKNTKPELLVRRVLTDRGIHYRLHVKKLPGKPDIVISKLRTVIFINGCFWHQHAGCRYSVMPKSNKKYWIPKLARNTQKQKGDIEKLKEKNWKVYVFWECELKSSKKLIGKKIAQILP